MTSLYEMKRLKIQRKKFDVAILTMTYVPNMRFYNAYCYLEGADGMTKAQLNNPSYHDKCTIGVTTGVECKDGMVDSELYDEAIEKITGVIEHYLKNKKK